MADLGVFLAFLSLMREAMGGGAGEGPPGPPGAPGQAETQPSYGPSPGVPSTPPTRIPPPGDIGPGTIPSAKPPIAILPVPPVPVAPPGGAPPMPPWPAPPTPGTLPPFPGPGWCPDTPVTPTVSSRASYWNPQLWNYGSKSIVKPYVQENLGGSWVTFAAAWHPGDKGPQTYMATEAWRLCAAPPVAPPAPSPAAPAVQTAAHAMNQALLAHGYKQADQGLYKTFQSAAGLSADGFPGSHTMAALASTLSAMGEPEAPVKVYPWSGAGGYDGVNAPTMAEWTGASPVSPHPTTAPTMFTGPPPLVSPYPGSGAYASNADYITRYQEALTWLAQQTGNPALNPGGIDGKYGPNTAAAVKAFQAAHGLSPVDGQAGAATASALDAAVSASGGSA